MNKIFIILFLLTYKLFLFATPSFSEDNKIKIGLLVPLTGENSEIGKQIVKATRLALNDINSNKIEIFPKDTNSNPNKALRSAIELNQLGINLIIGPVFYENLIYLDEVKNVIFLSFTNKTLDLPANVISTGINSISQFNTINKFIEQNAIHKKILLTPNLNYDQEIRKQNLFDEITRLENSDDPNKESKIKNLEKRYTIGDVNFDSVIIADFDESLKSVITSLLYADVSPKEKYFITLNQWFDESLLIETASQPIYYPSINKKNLEQFEEKFSQEFNENPNHLSLLSYDLVGLIYYLSLKNNLSDLGKAFKAKNSFKGKIGIFDIENNKINHRLNFYKIEDGTLKEIF